MKIPFRKMSPTLKIINNSLIDLPSPSNISAWWNFGSLLGLCLGIQLIKNIGSFSMTFFIMLSYMYFFYESFLNFNISESSILSMKILIPLNKFINILNSILILIIIYLLITLIVVIKIVDVKHGPLRKIN